MNDEEMRELDLVELNSLYDRGVMDVTLSTSYLSGWIDSEYERIDNFKQERGLPTCFDILDRLFNFCEELKTETYLTELRRRVREASEKKAKR